MECLQFEMFPIIYSDQFLEHDTGYGHPEKPQRLTSIVQMLHSVRWSDQLKWLEPQPIERRDPIPWIQNIHETDYIDTVQALAKRGGGRLDPDTTVSPQTFNVALLAVNAWLDGCDRVISEKSPVFVASRPPGHHAMPSYGMGFCIFNNVAIAAHYALAQPGIERVAIFDWDVHHGNGTQAIAEHHPKIYYCSLHQAPFYPGTGKPSETGKFQNILNVPIEAHTTFTEYQNQMEEKIVPFLQSVNPDMLLISAGYDATENDPLAQVCLQPADYQNLMRMCLGITERILLGLEGGYHCESLAQSVVATLSAYVKC